MNSRGPEGNVRADGDYTNLPMETGTLPPNLKGKSSLRRFQMDTAEFFQGLG